MRSNSSYCFRRIIFLGGALVFAGASLSLAQTSSPSTTADQKDIREAVGDLRAQVEELKSAVLQIRSEAAEYREETRALRQELATAKAAGSPSSLTDSHSAVVSAPSGIAQGESRGQSSSVSQAGSSLTVREAAGLSKLDEEYDLLSGKVNEQYQTKVESASKYRLRLSGIVLLNAFGNSGAADNSDVPSIALPQHGQSGGSVGGSLRQSQLGVEVFGPELLGAKTHADLQTDFGGGFAQTWNGVTSGLFRLRTATIRLDWTNTSITAGQDSIFFSPTSPTSFASLAVPSLSYAGNLWAWTPQINVENRIVLSESSKLLFQAGLLDPLSGEYPGQSVYRYPQAGESSRSPAFAARTAWVTTVFGQSLTLGVAGYYSRQNYGFDRTVNGWAAMTDWNLPLTSKLSLSGKFYRGQALAGVGGGVGRSVIFSGDPADPATLIQPLNVEGGWSQLKFRLNPMLEFNAAFGQEGSFASDLRAYYNPEAYSDPTLARNQSAFFNTIWRPRSDMIFSAEYRHLDTTSLTRGTDSLGHLNLSMGVLF